MEPCSVTNMCDNLYARINPLCGKGFREHKRVHAKTGRTIFQGVAYHTKPSDHGMWLNFCPFCGGKPGKQANKQT